VELNLIAVQHCQFFGSDRKEDLMALIIALVIAAGVYMAY
jgi:hypothetical protein